jgi:lipoate-protein ligase A
LLTVRDFDWDDELLESVRLERRPFCRVYQPQQVAVVLGRGSKPDVEVHLGAVSQDGVELLRRRGGGCSVVLDPGNLIVSAALPLPGFGSIKIAFEEISDWMISALDRAGVPDVYQEGISDLALNNRKIGGACIYRTRGLLYYSTTLLVNPRMDLVERYLKHPPREPSYRAERHHREFMGALADMALDTDIESFASEIDLELSKTVPRLESSLVCDDITASNRQEVLV